MGQCKKKHNNPIKTLSSIQTFIHSFSEKKKNFTEYDSNAITTFITLIMVHSLKRKKRGTTEWDSNPIKTLSSIQKFVHLCIHSVDYTKSGLPQLFHWPFMFSPNLRKNN